MRLANAIYKNQELETLNGEEWRDVVCYDGLYEVSNLGRVKRLERTVKCGKWGGVAALPEKICKQAVNKSYKNGSETKGMKSLVVNLSNGSGTYKRVHVSVLVGLSFVGDCKEGEVYSKMNKNWWDCRAVNLKITTDNDCILLSYKKGRHRRLKPCSDGKRTGPVSTFYVVRSTDGKRFLGRTGLRSDYTKQQANTIYGYSRLRKPYMGVIFYRESIEDNYLDSKER